jgi:hypothetical protein
LSDYALWSGNPAGLPGASTSFGGPTSCATLFTVTSTGISLKGFRWFVADGLQALTGVRFAAWAVSGINTGAVLAGSAVTSGALTAGFNDVILSVTVPLTRGLTYAAVAGDDARGPLTASYWASSVTSGPLTAFSDVGGSLADPDGNHQGCFQQASNDPTAAFPSLFFSSSNFWISPIVTDSTSAPVVLPRDLTGTAVTAPAYSGSAVLGRLCGGTAGIPVTYGGSAST